jgi:hypothetical protein
VRPLSLCPNRVNVADSITGWECVREASGVSRRDHMAKEEESTEGLGSLFSSNLLS